MLAHNSPRGVILGSAFCSVFKVRPTLAVSPPFWGIMAVMLAHPFRYAQIFQTLIA
nr:MAG TPA: hypothetical protein [Caudoviricetes sp.]